MIRIRDSYRLPGATPVTKWLTLLTLLSFFTQAKMGMAVFEMLGFIPAQFASPEAYDAEMGRIAASRPPGWLTAVTYTFLHRDIFHVAGNLIYFWIFAANVERKLGSMRFLFFYFSCAAVGALAHTMLNTDSMIPTIGASGAVMGMYGAYFANFPDHHIRVTIGTPRSSFYRDIPVPFKVFLIFWLVPELLVVLMPLPGTINSTAYMAHFGGFVAGYILSGGSLTFGRTLTKKPNFKVFPGGKAGA